MGLFDFCSMTTLLVMVTSIFIIVSVYGYITYKMADQDHKISSMIDLLSSMAQEHEILRNKLSVQFRGKETNAEHYNDNKNINLIEVSDDENASSEHDIDEDDDIDDDIDDDDEDDDEDEDDDDDDDESDNKSKYHLKTEQNGGTISIDDLLEEDDDISISSQLSDVTRAPNSISVVKSIHLEHIIPNTENNVDENISTSDNLSYLKSLQLTVPEETDFKKMSVQKLRSIIIEKGFLEDPSKLKKPELLKLIEEKSI